MIFLVHFGLKQHSCKFFEDHKLHSPWGLVKFACSDLSQIVLEIMQLPIHIVIASVYDVILDSWMLW